MKFLSKQFFGNCCRKQLRRESDTGKGEEKVGELTREGGERDGECVLHKEANTTVPHSVLTYDIWLCCMLSARILLRIAVAVFSTFVSAYLLFSPYPSDSLCFYYRPRNSITIPFFMTWTTRVIRCTCVPLIRPLAQMCGVFLKNRLSDFSRQSVPSLRWITSYGKVLKCEVHE